MNTNKWLHQMAGTLLIIFVFLAAASASQGAERESSEPRPREVTSVSRASALSNEVANQLTQAIAKPGLEPRILEATYEGTDAQAAVFTTPLQEFPRSGNQYIILSTGPAGNTPGAVTTFTSVDMGGVSIPGGSPDGLNAYDVATLTIRLALSDLATDPEPRLVFRYKFCSEEPPSFWGSTFQDYFTAIVKDAAGQPIENIARLPNGQPFTIDNARPFMNQVTGSSLNPLPPYPNPNDVVFNACTGIHTTDFHLTNWLGQEIELEFQIGDVADAIYDSAIFIDGLEIAAGPLPDFSVTRVEFNQASQSFAAGANVAAGQLLAGKQTAVRVYVKGENNTVDPKQVSAALHVHKDGTPIAGSPFTPLPLRITPVLNPSRTAVDANDRPTQTLQFYLPSSAISAPGGYQYFVMVDPHNEVDEADVLNNRFPAEGFNIFTLHSRPELNVLGYRVNTVAGNGQAVDSWDDTDEARYAEGRLLARTMLPAPAVRFWRVGTGRIVWNLATDGDLSTNAGVVALLNDIVERMENINDWSAVGYQTVVAMLPRNTNMTARGFAWVGRPGAIARTLEPDTLPHEIGHNWLRNPFDPPDQNHECSTSGQDGFDTARRRLRLNAPNLLCGGQVNRWVSPRTYSALFNNNELVSATTSAPHSQSQIMQQLVTEALRIRGLIDEDDNLELRPIYTIQAQDFTPDDPMGDYLLELQDQNQEVIGSWRFALSEMDIHEEPPIVTGRFSLVVPRPAGLKFIVIKELSTSETLGTATVSENSPTVTVLSPSGGETISGTFTVEWEASDPDGDPLTYAVLYTHDGVHWGVLANNLNQTSFEWDTSQSPGGTNASIRVIVTDGINTAVDVSATFTVATKAPEALIVAPEDGAAIPLGSLAVFVGTADDLEDGELGGEQMEWYSDLNGVLGTGSNIASTQLSAGTHTITLTATDSDGNTASDSISFSVVDTIPPMPTGLQAVPGDQQVTLQWDNGAGEFVEGYRVYWGTSSGIYGADINVGDVTSYTVTDLANGVTYYFAITAYDMVGNQSAFSDEVQATPEETKRLYLPIITRQ
jgi:hypothetical protein